MEPMAIGFYSLGVYYVLSLFFGPDGGGQVGWIFFGTGFWKHISVICLGLQDYFGHFCFVCHNSTKINQGGFGELVGNMAFGAFVEGCVFWGIGYGLFWGMGVKREWNIFWIGVLVYFSGVFGKEKGRPI